VRVAADHLPGDRVNHVAKVEALLLGSHLRVIDNLKQKIPKLLPERIEALARDRVGDFVGFV